MALVNVSCKPNTIPIRCNKIMDENGDNWSFTIREGNALIDEEGVIRFFFVTDENDHLQGYKLCHMKIPGNIFSMWEQIPDQIRNFLIDVSLEVVKGQVLKKLPNGEKIPVEDVVGYIFKQGGKIIKDFSMMEFLDAPKIYYDVATNKGPGLDGPINAPRGAY